MAKKEANISFIVVNYNTFDYTKKCLESVDKYCHDGKIILIDNNSPDNSGKRLKEYFHSHSHIKVILNEKNLGFGAANNLGVKEATGDYLCFLNPDAELVEPLTPLIGFLEKNPDVGAVGVRLLNTDGTFQPSVYRFNTLADQFFSLTGLSGMYSNLVGAEFNTPVKVDFVRGAFIFIKKDIFLSVGGFDEDYFLYAEEADLCKRLTERGYFTYYYPLVSVVHHQNKSGEQFEDETYILKRQSLLLFFKKNKGWFQFYVLKLVLAATTIAKIIYFYLMMEIKGDKFASGFNRHLKLIRKING